MILGYASLYSPDDCERALPDAAAARRLFADRGADIPARLSAIASRIGADARVLDAVTLGTARLGLRHGSFGQDFHDYHNENHVMEIAERRLSRLLDSLAAPGMGALESAALLLFAACHDLRQREPYDVPGPVGGNEAASISETFRLLDQCGFDRQDDRPMYVALELMIAGSTFDASPTPAPDPHGGELASVAGGALARGLSLWLDAEVGVWRMDPDARRGERLGRVAADLDTANVGEDFALFCESALRLCREREMRSGRDLKKAESAATCLGFLAPGQVHYFFDLHSFCSREGEHTFGPQKLANAERLRFSSGTLTKRFARKPASSGAAVIAAFKEINALE
jgi:hypothetical protein